MLKKSVGGLAFLAFVFTFMSPSLPLHAIDECRIIETHPDPC